MQIFPQATTQASTNMLEERSNRVQAALGPGAVSVGAASDGILRSALVVITAPVIYALALPLLVLDVCVTIYQRVCFPVYGISPVRRSDHFVFDRGRLAYLGAVDKFNCLYCSYANGVISYVRETGGRTEQYWCAIKHARETPTPHDHYSRFAKYGDQREYERRKATLRDELQ